MSDPHRIFNDLGRGCGSMNMLPKPADSTIINLSGKSLCTVLCDAAGQSGNIYKMPAATLDDVGRIVICVGYDSVGGGDGVLIKNSTAATTHATLEPGEIAILVGTQSATSTFGWVAVNPTLKSTGAT